MNRCNQQQLLRYIQQINLALLDVVLFLDTHPNDRNALNYYEKCKVARMEATALYAEKFGPLQIDNVNTSDGFSWVDSPWPWEGEV